MTKTPAAAASRATKPVAARLVTALGGRRPTGGGQVDQGLGQGMEMALSLVVFLGIGWALDAWLDTRPIFTIALVVFAALGQGVKMWFVYDARMKRLEAERRAATTAHNAPVAPSEQARGDQGPNG